MNGGSYLVTNQVEDDEYAFLWFPKVLEGLKRRKMDEIVLEICDRKPDVATLPIPTPGGQFDPSVSGSGSRSSSSKTATATARRV